METDIQFSVRHDKRNVYLMISFRHLCVFTVSLPLFTLVICFVSAYIYQQSEIHETHCRVYNVIPSISAITGISPERYLWRVSIALHLGPRFLIAHVYYKYYLSLISILEPPEDRIKFKRLVTVSYWLSIVEILALVGVTYISNQDNYPVHEKIFILFMMSSLAYMLLSLYLFERTHAKTTGILRLSLIVKRILFVLSVICTIGLVIFFMKHRLFCHDLAFTWFALCEYIIASANMGYHITVYLDFPKEYMIIAQPENVESHHKRD